MVAKILICEDQDVLRSLAREALKGDQRQITEAATGTESIELARRLRPDVVVLDMIMPDGSGLDVLAALRADPALADAAIVLVSGAAALAGAAKLAPDRFLLKPYSVSELRATVEELLAERGV